MSFSPARMLWLSLGVGSAVACTADVEYLRAGGGGGADPGSGGSSGTGGGSGNTSSGGTTSTGGSAGTGGGAAGSAGAPTGPCKPNSALIEDYDFASAAFIQNVSKAATKGRWSKGPYDSTDTRTGRVNNNSIPIPPDNPLNIANLSKLEHDVALGSPKPAMRLSVPFATKPVEEEHMHVLVVLANYQEPLAAIDISGRRFTAQAMLNVHPNTNCVITVNAWTTTTDSRGELYNHVDGPRATLIKGSWVNIEMDLDTSANPTLANQYGFVIHSKCTVGTGSGVGGAAGAAAGGEAGQGGEGGASAGAAGAAGSTSGGQGGTGGENRPMSVILFDNISLDCK